MNKLKRGQHVLVLGGSGFIGSHLIPEFVKEGFTITNYDLFEPLAPLPEQVRDIRGDIRDRTLLASSMRGVDAVLNLAAAHHDFGVSVQTFQSVNVKGAAIITEVMEEVGVTNFCFYSSVAIYGEQEKAPSEDSPATPINEYGRTKYLAELQYRDWKKRGKDRRLLVLRPAVVFGPRNFANVYRMIDQIARGRFYPVGPGSNVKSMVYVENIVAAILWLWLQPSLHPSDTYNCVDKPDLTSAQIIEQTYTDLGKRKPLVRIPLAPAILAAKPFDAVARLTGRNLPITSARIRKIAAAETKFDSTRLLEAGFTAPLSLTTGLRRMITWYRNEGRDAEHSDHLPPAEPVIAP